MGNSRSKRAKKADKNLRHPITEEDWQIYNELPDDTKRYYSRPPADAYNALTPDDEVFVNGINIECRPWFRAASREGRDKWKEMEREKRKEAERENNLNPIYLLLGIFAAIVLLFICFATSSNRDPSQPIPTDYYENPRQDQCGSFF